MYIATYSEFSPLGKRQNPVYVSTFATLFTSHNRTSQLCNVTSVFYAYLCKYLVGIRARTSKYSVFYWLFCH